MFFFNNNQKRLNRALYATSQPYRRLFIGLLFVVTGCAETSYQYADPGDNLQRSVSLIYLKDVIPRVTDSAPQPSGDEQQTGPEFSSDDLFIAKLVRTNLAIDLARNGYTVTTSPAERHDADMTVFLFYQPDDWPFANRYIHLWAELSRPDGTAILRADTTEKNWYGPFGDRVGFSGEQMIARTTHQIVSLIHASPAN